MNDRGHGGDIYTYQIGNEKREVIDFSANINPLGLCEGVKNALYESMSMVHNYPDPNQRKLKEAIAENENINKEWIVCGNGAADIIFRLVYAKKPGKSLVLAPTFSEYEEALKTVGCEVVYYQLKEKDKFEVQVDILEMIDSTLDMVWVCNPNNPTGKTIDINILTKILTNCEKNDVLLVVDECFNDFIYNSQKYTLKNKLHSPNLFILKAFTKIYAVPGIRLGYGMASSSIIKSIEKVGQTWSVSSIAQHVGVEAVKEKEYVQKTIEVIQKQRIYLTEELRNIGFKVYSSRTNYILFKNPYKIDLKKELESYNILIRSCGNYRGLDQTYYRIAIRLYKENQKLIYALKKICLK